MLIQIQEQIYAMECRNRQNVYTIARVRVSYN